MYRIRWTRVFALSAALGVLVLLLRGCAIACAGDGGADAAFDAEAFADTPVRVYDAQSGRTETRSLETYLVGVVAAEMPASFHEEALRAQAVAARTYTVYRALHGGCNAHDADVCTSSACCQAFATDEQLRERWGADYAENLARIETAVFSTAGEVLLYDGAPIEALYHSASGGYTEDSENVFANAVPYLRAVESPNEVGTARLTGSVSFTREAFCDLVNGALEAAALSPDELESQVEVTQRSESGRVQRLRLGGVSLSGREARGLLGLDSALFTIAFSAGGVRFDTRGYGHGVGMSQTGANAMGIAGSDYEEILLHYYTGTSLGPIP